MIELHELVERYGPKTAVDGLDFTVRPGVVTGFLGPNGAGKSTTMRRLARFRCAWPCQVPGSHRPALSQ